MQRVLAVAAMRLQRTAINKKKKKAIVFFVLVSMVVERLWHLDAHDVQLRPTSPRCVYGSVARRASSARSTDDVYFLKWKEYVTLLDSPHLAKT